MLASVVPGMRTKVKDGTSNSRPGPTDQPREQRPRLRESLRVHWRTRAKLARRAKDRLAGNAAQRQLRSEAAIIEAMGFCS